MSQGRFRFERSPPCENNSMCDGKHGKNAERSRSRGYSESRKKRVLAAARENVRKKWWNVARYRATDFVFAETGYIYFYKKHTEELDITVYTLTFARTLTDLNTLNRLMETVIL
jgi:hypothetical protein